MKYSFRWVVLVVFSLVLWNTTAAGPLFGDIITGTYMLPPTGDSKIIPLSGGQFDPNTVTMGICTPEDLLVDVTGYFLRNPFVAIGLNDGQMTPQFRIDCATMGEAIFGLVSPLPPGTGNVDFNNFPDAGGEFSAQVHLNTDPTGLFGSFTDALFIISYSGLVLDPNGDGRAHWPNTPGGTASIHFALASIPEPTSLALALCGLIGLAGILHREKRSHRSRL
jgi:hypothetical protein